MKSDSQSSPPQKGVLTRRRVLAGAGALAASTVMAGGGYVLYSRALRFGRDTESRIPDHRVTLPAAVPRMVIARGSDPALNVRAALERVGGMGRFITADDVVVIKPNIGWDRTPEQGANTHPEVVAEIVRACREVGPQRIMVSDCPVRDSMRALELSGIRRAATEAGAEVLAPENSRYRRVLISPRLGIWDVLEPFAVATKVINVPVAKHHSLTGVSAGLKNWIGITTKMRVIFHNDIQRSMAELAALMRPTLTILDATRALMDHGPEGGNVADVKPLNTVALGVDPVALDAWVHTLLGISSGDYPECLTLAASMGLGTVDFASLGPVEIVTG